MGRYTDRRLGDLVIAGLAAVCACTPVPACAEIPASPASAGRQAQVEPVRSADGRRMAYTVARGWPRPLMTEVWTASGDGSDPRRVKVYLGAPGDLGFLPGDEGLVYLQRGLSYALFGSYLYGGREASLVRNRVWRMPAGGAGEAVWPLPDDLQAVRIAVSPDGQRLAVCGYRGELPERGDRSLWVVDRTGRAVLVENDGVDGPLGWSEDSEEVFCALEEGGGPVRVRVGTGETRQRDGAGVVASAGGKEGQVLSLIGKAMDQYMKGYHAMHRGGRHARTIRSAYRGAIQAFEQIYKSRMGISEADCQNYIQAIRKQADRGMEARRQAVCLEHQLILGDLILQYAQTHGQIPTTLEDLHSWTERRVEGEASEEAIRKRDLRALAHLFRCSTDPDEGRSISYVYRPEAGSGDPLLTCFWHRGRLLHLARTPGSFRGRALEFHSGRIDSLDAAAARYLAAGAADSAVALLEVVSHQRHKAPVAHYKYGYAAFKARDYGRAEKAFKKVSSMSKGVVLSRAYYGMGLIHTERPRGLYTAVHYFRDALILDRDYVDARFQMARIRVQLWEYDAKSDIEKVLEMNPDYADAYLLMGDYYADLMEDYEQAILWYTKYLALRPEDENGRVRLSMAYLQVKDYDKIMDILLKFLLEHPDAIELMPIVAQACVKREKHDMAMSFFRSYISNLDPEERALYEDISRFASPEELDEAARTAEREAFLKRFWNGRDPDLSTPVNERLLEHYRRVWYARQSFSGGQQPWDMRGEVYVRLGEPDHRTSSQMMNASQSLDVQRVKDRMARAIYGKDGTEHTFIGPVFPVRSMALESRVWEGARQIRTTEGGGVRYGTVLAEQAFEQEEGEEQELDTEEREERIALSATGRERAGASENFDLMRDLLEDAREHSLRFGKYSPVTTTGVDIATVSWESWVYTRVGGGVEITFTDEGGTGVFGHAPMPMVGDISPAQFARFARYAPERVFEQAVAAFPDFYTPEYDVAPFDFYFDVADFRGNNGYSALEIYYGLPGTAARYVPEEDVTRLVVKRQAGLVGAALDTVYRVSGDLFFQMSGRGGVGAVVPDVVRLELPPGAYRLEVRVRDRMTGRIGLYRKDVRVEGYTQEGLQLSSLELAWRIAEDQPLDKFSKSGLNVIPMPTRMYPKGRSVFVYYEIYNLVRDEFGQTKYRVEYTIRPAGGNIVSRLVRTFVGKKEEVVVGYEQVGYGETEVVHTELDLGETTPGRHYLKVTVTDLNSEDEERVVKDVPFMVGRGGG